MPEDFKAGFLKTLWILRDYLPVMVIGGGWVPLLYDHYLIADKYKEPIMTRDIDVLVDIDLPVMGDKTVEELLLDEGFKPTFKSLGTPPVIHYEGIIDGDEVEIGFLTDQRGAKDDVVIEVQKGLHAEALRFVAIPINHAIEVTIYDFLIGGEYHPWFSRFIKNLQENFSDLTSDGIIMISSQRPTVVFPELTNEQFRQYVLGIFHEFIEELSVFGGR